jgi:hypothetical protein
LDRWITLNICKDGWTLRRRNNDGTDRESEWNPGWLREFETPLDGEIEAITDLIDYYMDHRSTASDFTS